MVTPSSPVSVLWVDDELAMVSQWTQVLGRFGFEVISAGSPETALDLWRERTYDLLLIDLNLGSELTGVDVVRAIRSVDSTTPIVILSGYLSDARFARALDDLKLDGRVSKPLPLAGPELERLLLSWELLSRRADLKRLERKYPTVQDLEEVVHSPGAGMKALCLRPTEGRVRVLFEDVVEPLLVSLGLEVTLVEDEVIEPSVFDQLTSALARADLIVADLTDRGSSVVYGLGLAHGLGKPAILCSRSVDAIPLELRHRRCLVYDDDPVGLRQFREALDTAARRLVRAIGSTR